MDVRELARVVCPSNSRKRYLFMLSLYLDDSGDANNQNETVFAMGGCIASTNRWAKFDEQWGIALDEADISRDKGFHATDFFARKIEPYNSWTDREHARFARLFSAIAETHFVVGVGRGVDVPAFNRIVRPVQFLVRGFELFGVQARALSALIFTARPCMEYVGHLWHERPKGEEIAVVIASGPGVGVAIEYFRHLQANAHRYVKRYWTDGFSSFTSAPSSSLFPLQAADLVAYEARLKLAKRTESNRREPRPSFNRLTRRNHLSIRTISEGGLTRYVNEMEHWNDVWDAMTKTSEN